MVSKNSSKKEKVIGVIGVGSFGTVIANMLAEKSQVIVYSRKAEVVAEINSLHNAPASYTHVTLTTHPYV